jgi:hypothetical protein
MDEQDSSGGIVDLKSAVLTLIFPRVFETRGSEGGQRKPFRHFGDPGLLT